MCETAEDPITENWPDRDPPGDDPDEMPPADGTGGGVLILAAVPIGRAEDASARLVAELARASLIAAEDTRRCAGWRRA